jgi:VWFA-related protein
MSGSQASSSVYPVAVEAASEFSNQVLSGSDDEAFFERFASAPQATRLMTRREFLALKIDLNPYGLSALYDGVRFACDERMKENSPRDALRVIVLLSDGDDNHSHSNLKQAIASAQRAGVVIFAVDTSNADPDSDVERSVGSETLLDLAEQTGGMAFLRLGTGGVSKAFTAIKEQIDNMYLLSFVPADDSQAAQRRSFQLKPALKKDLKLRAPKGYYGIVVP